MADNGISKEEMSELFAKFFGEGKAGGLSGVKFDEKDLIKFKDQIKQTTDALKKSTPSFSGAWETFLAGSKETRDELKRFDESIKKLSETTSGAEKLQKEKALLAQKEQYAQAAAHKQLATAAVGAGVAFGGIASDMAQGAMDFVKSLQSGASGVEIGTQAAKNTATMGFKAAQGLAGLADGVSSVVMLMGPWGMAIGVLMKVISGFVGWFSKDAQKLTEQALQGLGDELKKTQKGFKDITGAGAVMGGGMTEMRQQAARAGLDIEQLATVVKDAKEDLAGMGLGLGEATKRVAGVSKELRNSELGTQLQKLGYSFEEQAELSAAVMANQNAAGNTRILSDKELAATTAKYGKDLKILADATGQDAKKVAEKARIDSLKAVLDAKLTGQQRETYQGILRGIENYPDDIKEAVLQKVAGGPVTNVGAILAMQQNEELAKSVDLYAKTVQDGSMDSSQAQQLALEQTEKIGAAQNAANKKSVAMLEAGLYSQSDVVQQYTKNANALTVIGAKQKEGAAKTAKEEADKMAANMAPLDVAVTTLEANTQKLKAALGEQLTGPITGFANSLVKGMDTIDDALEQFGIVTDRQKAKKAAAKMPAMVGGGSAPGMAVTGEVDLSGGGAGGGSAPPSASETPATSGGGGGKGPELATISSKSGKTTSVGKAYAPAFQKLLDYLDSVGYDISSLGGYVDRDVRGKPGVKSIHASGGAIDINPGANPMGNSLITDMPSEIGKVAASLGLGWGGNWKSVKDAMHFSAASNEGGSLLKAANGAMIPAHPGGTPVLAGEAGRNEAIVPLASGGKLLGMDELIEAVNRLVRVAEDQHSTSEKILYATA